MTIYRSLKSGDLPGFRGQDGFWRFDLHQVTEWLGGSAESIQSASSATAGMIECKHWVVGLYLWRSGSTLKDGIKEGEGREVPKNLNALELIGGGLIAAGIAIFLLMVILVHLAAAPEPCSGVCASTEVGGK